MTTIIKKKSSRIITNRRFFSTIAFVICFCFTSFGQTKINYKCAFSQMRPSLPDQIIMTGNVLFTHEGMQMHCDSAIFNEKENWFNAFGHIHIEQGDTLHVWGDELYYVGASKIAEMFSSPGKLVTMKDRKTVLKTTYLVLEREPKTVSYTRWADINDDKSTLRSRFGVYHLDSKDIDFLTNVVIHSDSSSVFSDSLTYNTKTNLSTFHGPTNIITKDSTFIYTEEGYYNTKTEESRSFKQSQMLNKDRLLQADTLTYNSVTKIGEGFHNIYMEDTLQKVVATGHRAYINNNDTSAYTFLTNMAQIRQVDKEDTLYLHSDTIWINHDTAMNVKSALAFSHTKFFRPDFQGAADTIFYLMEDSTVTMIGRPILFNDDNQLTADTIVLSIGKHSIYSALMYPNPFVAQNADTLTQGRYNQVSGRRMKGFFDKHNNLYLVEVHGNAQSIYYLWDEKKNKPKDLMGLNVGQGSEMRIYVEKKKIKKITTITNPVFFAADEERVSKDEKFLKGFQWRDTERPKTKEDIFI